MTRCLALALAAAILGATPAHASTTSERLRAKVARLTRSRDHFKRLAEQRAHRLAVIRGELATARQGAAGTLPAAVTAIAEQGRISLVEDLVWEPLRNHWPCGSVVFEDPSTFWEMHLFLRDTQNQGVPRSCDDKDDG